jgi:FkbM family methyltransferase
VKFLGRDVRRYTENASHGPAFILYFARCLWTFKRPLSFLRCYVTKTLPSGREIQLRNGFRILLTENPDDVVTAFTIFARREYGHVQDHSIAVDVGANIGLFAMYAAWKGARKVYAYEPCAESFLCLQASVRANGLEDVIVAQQRVVADRAGEHLPFPKVSRVTNSVLVGGVPQSGRAAEREDEYELVESIDLAGILDAHGIEHINLLKLDCEGSEYDILFTAPPSVLRSIDWLKLEYHKGGERQIADFLGQFGFRLVKQIPSSPSVGVLWLSRGASAATSVARTAG